MVLRDDTSPITVTLHRIQRISSDCLSSSSFPAAIALKLMLTLEGLKAEWWQYPLGYQEVIALKGGVTAPLLGVTRKCLFPTSWVFKCKTVRSQLENLQSESVFLPVKVLAEKVVFSEEMGGATAKV